LDDVTNGQAQGSVIYPTEPEGKCERLVRKNEKVLLVEQEKLLTDCVAITVVLVKDLMYVEVKQNVVSVVDLRDNRPSNVVDTEKLVKMWPGCMIEAVNVFVLISTVALQRLENDSVVAVVMCERVIRKPENVLVISVVD